MNDLVAPLEYTPQGLVTAIRAAGYEAELFESDSPMPTVPAAAGAIGVDEHLILKTLLFQDKAGDLIRVIASGPDRIDRKRLAELAGIGKPVLAPADVVLAATGWPPGGVAPVGSRQPLPTFIDERILDFERVYGGGGTEHTLIGLVPQDIVAITNGRIANLRSP